MELETRYVEFEADEDSGLVLESRSGGEEILRGYAIVYDKLSLDLGGFREVIRPGAFDKILSRQRGRVDLVSYYNHEPNMILGRESAGTLEVFSDKRGVGFVLTSPGGTSYGNDLLVNVRRKNIKGASFAFTVDQKGQRFSQLDEKTSLREIVDATGLFELGPVTNPAYVQTSIAAAVRSLNSWRESIDVRHSETPEPAAQAVQSRSALRGVAAAWAATLRLKRHV